MAFQTIGLWIDGIVAEEIEPPLGGDWGGGNAASLGTASNAMAVGNWGDNPESGSIDLEEGLQIFTSAYPVNEIELRSPFVCTFPGHAILMRGEIIVKQEGRRKGAPPSSCFDGPKPTGLNRGHDSLVPSRAVVVL